MTKGAYEGESVVMEVEGVRMWVLKRQQRWAMRGKRPKKGTRRGVGRMVGGAVWCARDIYALPPRSCRPLICVFLCRLSGSLASSLACVFCAHGASLPSTPMCRTWTPGKGSDACLGPHIPVSSLSYVSPVGGHTARARRSLTSHARSQASAHLQQLVTAPTRRVNFFPPVLCKRERETRKEALWISGTLDLWHTVSRCICAAP